MVSMTIDVNGNALPVSGLSSDIVIQVPRTSHTFVGSRTFFCFLLSFVRR